MKILLLTVPALEMVYKSKNRRRTVKALSSKDSSSMLEAAVNHNAFPKQLYWFQTLVIYLLANCSVSVFFVSQINNMVFLYHDLLQTSTQHIDKKRPCFIGFGEKRKNMCMHLLQETYKYNNKYAFVIASLHIWLRLADGESSNFWLLQKDVRLPSDWNQLSMMV